MHFKPFEFIKALITNKFDKDIIVKEDATAIQPSITVDTKNLVKICQFLHDTPELYFDSLSCLTAIDNGVEANSMEVIYHLYSIPHEYSLVLKVEVERNTEEGKLPQVPSVSSIWKTADWHEREAFDLVGIEFTNHPDLRRILLPSDWEGYPLRKDYKEQEEYHGIKVKYASAPNPTPNP